jgi:hypothetical protein
MGELSPVLVEPGVRLQLQRGHAYGHRGTDKGFRPVDLTMPKLGADPTSRTGCRLL